jgi:hypothetical protein
VTTGTVVAGLPRTPANQLSRSDATCVQHEKPRTWLRDEAALQWLECVSVRDLGVVAQLRELQDALNRNGYHKYCVWGHQALDATEQNIAEYCACLDRADSEKPLQEFLEAQPLLLTAEEGSQCRCVVPRKSLGGMFVPDFLVGRLDSPGLLWKLVELQSPRAQLFTKRDRPADQLREGIEQILRWRRWLTNNRDFAIRPPSQTGATWEWGPPGISPDP